MGTTQRGPTIVMIAAGVLAIVVVGGWSDAFIQSETASAASHDAQTQRAGLEARVAALRQDLSNANAQAQSFAVQAKTAGIELAAAQQRVTALTGQLAEAQAHEKQALAEANRQIDVLKASHTAHRTAATKQRPPRASTMTSRVATDRSAL